MCSPSPSSGRIGRDVAKLFVLSSRPPTATPPPPVDDSSAFSFSLAVVIRIESNHDVTILGGLNEFYVKFAGPSGSEIESNAECA